ncbi:MAG: cupin domain-containing protein [Alphaproteobacteria bacterium]
MTLAEKTDAPIQGPAHANPATAPRIQGRRDFFEYIDLGVKQASGGQLMAQVMKTKKGLSEPTGWHYHTCESQFIYVIKGWVDLDFETGESIRVGAGESLYIPGGLKHNETATSEELEILEVAGPSELGTVPVDTPPGMKG